MLLLHIIVFHAIVLYSNAFALAIEVSPNSPCAPLCIDKPGGNVSDWAASTTQFSDLICDDPSYSNTPIGRKWMDCVRCESSSPYWDLPSNENDAYWFLHNSKFNLIWCLFSSSATSAPASRACGSSCSQIQTLLEDQLNSGDMTTQYNYCGSDPTVLTAEFNACRSCLDTEHGVQTLVNCKATFLDKVNIMKADIATETDLQALIEGCQQRPSTGTALKLDFDPFNAVNGSHSTVNAPSTSATVTTASATVTTASSTVTSTSATVRSTSSWGLASTAGASISASSSSSTTASVTTSTSLPTGVSTPLGSPVGGTASSSNKITIAGVICSAVGAVLAVILLGLFVRRSRRRKAEVAGHTLSGDHTSEAGHDLSSEHPCEVDLPGARDQEMSELNGRVSLAELGFHTPRESVRPDESGL